MAFEPLVSGEWLAEHMAAATPLRVVHVSNQRKTYDETHIPGAIFSDLHVDLAGSGVRPETGAAPRRYILPTRAEVAEAVGRWSIGPGMHLVFYDDAGQNRYAARGYWLLRVYGFPANRVHLLNGGLTAWQADGRPTTAEGPATPPVTTPQPLGDPDPSLLATAEDVLAWSREATSEAGADGDRPTRLLDVRLIDEFLGTDVRARRGGRIPGARHRLFSDFVGPDGRLRDAAQAIAILEGSGVRPGELRATYCHGGVRAALAWFVLHEVAGLSHVRNYAGSWEEWGNRPELPVEE